MTTLTVRADRQLIRAASRSERYLLASITAPSAPPRDHRMPVNVAFVLDRSGSMAGEDKLSLAIEAVERSLSLLGDDDRFSLVAFDTHVQVITRSTSATPTARRRAIGALREMQPGSSTDLCAGWMTGCDELAGHLEHGTISRALLLTDGQANHGETNRVTLANHAAELHRRGITTSAFGVGADFDERLLRDLATEGGGNFYFIQRAAQIPDLIASELGEALEVVMPRAELTVSIPHGGEMEVMHRFRSRRANGRTVLVVELGDLVSGQMLDVVFRARFPLGDTGETQDVLVSLGEHAASVRFTYAGHAANDDQPRDREVDRHVARVYATRARADATEANRHGDFDRARRALADTARHIQEHAGGDAELAALATALEEEVPQYAGRLMEPMALKSAFYAAESSGKGRRTDGSARRGSSR